MNPLSTPAARPPPYHTFEAGGTYFLYDTTSCRFFRIDHATHVFLTHCLTGQPEDARQKLQQEYGYSAEEADTIDHEVSLLRQQGLLQIPDYSMSETQFEAQLTHRYETAWNKLELALAETCNLACTYCYCGTCRDMPNQGLMSGRVARQAITWLFAASGKSDSVSITLFGGEPLMNKPVLRFVIEYSQRLGRLHGKKVFYSMTTNGTLLDDEVIGFIKKYNFGLMVSLDGPPEIHNKQCPTQNGQPSFESAAAGIKKLMKRRRTVTVRSTMTHPVPNMLGLIRFYEDFGFTRIVLGKTTNPVHASPVDCTEQDFHECARQEYEELIPWMLDKLSKGETPKYYPYRKFVEEMEAGTFTPKVTPFKCGACRGTTTVGADGTLYPCHRFVGMQDWRIGNITDGPDYAKCKQFWRDYRAATAPQCSACWLWAQCHGPCPWEMAQADGTFRIPETHCQHVRSYACRGAYFYDKKQTMEQQRLAQSDKTGTASAATGEA